MNIYYRSINIKCILISEFKKIYAFKKNMKEWRSWMINCSQGNMT